MFVVDTVTTLVIVDPGQACTTLLMKLCFYGNTYRLLITNHLSLFIEYMSAAFLFLPSAVMAFTLDLMTHSSLFLHTCHFKPPHAEY